MSFLYSTENMITSTTLPEDNAIYRSSEDAIYQIENLRDTRPSRPFRFTGKAAEWVKIDLGYRRIVSLFAIFNHNIQAVATHQLHCSGNNGAWKLIANLAYRKNDLHERFGVNERWFRYSVGDATNPDPLTIGEMWLGLWNEFSYAKLQSPRGDGPEFWTVDQITPYGQDWDAYLSENEKFSISLQNVNDRNGIDEVQLFLESVFEAGNRFVFIPNRNTPHVYYCKITNKSDFANRRVFGDPSELRDWNIEIKTLTRGIILL